MYRGYTYYTGNWNYKVIEVGITCLSDAKVPGYCDIEVEYEDKKYKLDIIQVWPTRDGAAKALFNYKLGNDNSKITLGLLDKRYIKGSISTSQDELERRFFKEEETKELEAEQRGNE